ncbi:MAG: acetate--CoA ligase family protein [bacterium]|nr:acetate--CoA ligase family protein [bacterium]
MTETDLIKFFEPRSVAVIGASNIIGKWGFTLPLNILTGGYRGKLFLINPKEKVVLGMRAFPDLQSVPGEIDLAVLTIPAERVEESVRLCGQRGIPFALVISSDFAEAGKEGEERERRLVRTARESGVRIVGPNTMGYFSSSSRLTAMGIIINPTRGNLGLVTQSGNLGQQLMNRGKEEGIGISRFVGSGNEADLTSTDFIEFLGRDPETRVIALYLEGIKDGRRFFEVARKVSREKPIIVLKTGKTEVGARVARSHSGAVVNDAGVAATAFRQSGIIEVGTTDEVIDVARALLHLPVPAGNRVGIMTMGGGWGVVTTEICVREGLRIPELPEELKKHFDSLLPPFWSRGNPVDLVGTPRRRLQFEVMEKMAQVPEFDFLLVMGVITGAMFTYWDLLKRFFISFFNFAGNHFWAALSFYPSVFRKSRASLRKSRKERKNRPAKKTGGIDLREIKDFNDELLARRIQGMMGKYRKPMIAISGVKNQLLELTKEFDLVVYDTPERGAKVGARMAEYGVFRHKDSRDDKVAIDPERVSRVRNLIPEFPGLVPERVAKEILALYGIPVTREKLAGSPEEAVQAARGIGYPVALKVESPQVVHKTEAGGVKLGLDSDQAVIEGFRNIIRSVGQYDPHAQISGILVQEMARGGVEVFAGVSRDPSFGPVLAFGLGGIFVEILKDISLRLPPVGPEEALAMVTALRGFPLLAGARGRAKADITKAVEILTRLSTLSLELEGLVSEVDINPLMLFGEGQGGLAVDARMIRAD